MNPLWTHGALELAAMISRREVSCAEVVEAHLGRIAAVNLASECRPIGVLLTGARFRDDQCLDAAEAIEQRCGLATPIDPVH